METRRVVVVGGGNIALRKVKDLLKADAQVTVISPEVCAELTTLFQAGCIDLKDRSYQDGDLNGVFFVVAATDNSAINQAVYHEAITCGCLANIVDAPHQCDFFVPATLRFDDLSIAISSGGGSPALARWLRHHLETLLEPELGELSALLEELRPQITIGIPDTNQRLALIDQLIASNILQTFHQAGKDAAKIQIINLLEKLASTGDKRGPNEDFPIK